MRLSCWLLGLVFTLAAPLLTRGQTTASSAEATTITEEKRHKNQIKCLIENQMSSERCRTVVASQTSDDDDLGAGCAKLESFKDLVTVLGCTYNDYNTLHDAICDWDGSSNCINYYRMQLALVTQAEQSLRPACNKSLVGAVKDEALSKYCQGISQQKDALISQGVCNSSEVVELEKVVCCTGVTCFEPLDLSTREGQVTLALRRLDSKCSLTLSKITDKLMKPPTEACSSLQLAKPALQAGLVCSAKDFENLEKVVCTVDPCSPGSLSSSDCTTPVDPFPQERAQRDSIQQMITGNELQQKCKAFMEDQANQQINDPLEKTCKNFLDNRGFIVVGGQCTAEEFDKLKLVICGKGQARPVLVSTVVIVVSLLCAVMTAKML